MEIDNQQIIEVVGTSLICFGIPGLLFIFDGIRTIKNKKAILIDRDSHFRWQDPFVLTGNKANENGRAKIIFGAALFLIGICIFISLFF